MVVSNVNHRHQLAFLTAFSAIGVLFSATSCSSTDADQGPTAAVSTITEPAEDLSDVPPEFVEFATKELSLFDHPYPKRAPQPGLLALFPEVEGSTMATDQSESTTLVGIDDTGEAEFVFSEGDIFTAKELAWHCAWAQSYVDSMTNSEDEAANEALSQLQQFPKFDQVSEYVEGAEDLTTNLVSPAVQGDTEPIENYAASCISGNE